jgi:hypothetical protein
VDDAEMVSPEEILDGTDWSVLEHAYGSADELSRLLPGLLGEDPGVAGEVLGVLDGAVLHQGTIYSSTAPAALFVAGILTDARTGITCGSSLPWDGRIRPLRAALLEWLGLVGESASYCDDDPDDAGEAEMACQAIRPELYRAIAPFIWDVNTSVRSEAVVAAGHLLRAPGLTEFRAALAERLLESAPRSEPTDRARLALILDGWRIAPRELLSDPDPAVRAYAATATTLDDDPYALAEMRAALRDPDAVNRWFDGRHPQREGWFLDTLVTVLLRRTTTFEDIEDEAMAIAMASDGYARQCSLTTLWLRAFPPDLPDSPAQQRFRDALDKREHR